MLLYYTAVSYTLLSFAGLGVKRGESGEDGQEEGGCNVEDHRELGFFFFLNGN